IHLRQNNSVIIIDSYTTSVSANIFSMEGSEINIGSNCMLSSSVYIRNSDEHPIYDLESNERINHAKPVFIGNNVWLCEGVTVNKGSIIPDGCVIGAKSFVSKELKRKNSIYSGVPAQLIR
ncbi:TPA: acyltransferase, partial [Escherichia coli]|nr:acyltransferase [Escherichia coli]